MILIVGGMGFIGLNTALRFVETGQKVVVSQHHARRVPETLEREIAAGRVAVARLDVTTPARFSGSCAATRSRASVC